MSKLGSLANPIQCDGPSGERAYLSRLLGPDQQFLIFERTGSLPSPNSENMIDLYQVESIDGGFTEQLYFDMYHPNYEESETPPGLLRLSNPDVAIQAEFNRLPQQKQKEERLKEQYGEHTCEHFWYTHSKATRLLHCGPAHYAQDDFFGLPYFDFDLASILQACHDLSVHLNGLFKQHPLRVSSTEAAVQFVQTFHFEPENISLRTNEPFLLRAIHRMSSATLELWFAADIPLVSP